MEKGKGTTVLCSLFPPPIFLIADKIIPSFSKALRSVCTLCLLLTTQNVILVSPGLEISGDVQSQGVGVYPTRIITTVQLDF